MRASGWWGCDVRLMADDLTLLARYDAALGSAERRAGEHIRCRVGCTECCHGAFEITALDACRLLWGLAEMHVASPAAAQGLRGRAGEQWRAMALEFPGDRSMGVLDADEAAREAFFARFDVTPCPVLEPGSGACLLYSHRPLSCRSFGLPVRCGPGVLPPCRLNFTQASAREVADCVAEPDADDLEGPLLRELGRRGIGGETVVAAAIAFTSTGHGQGERVDKHPEKANTFLMGDRPRGGDVAADRDAAGDLLEKRLASVLEEHGYALTAQRRLIFRELALASDHPTAEELYLRLRRQLPELSLATVYKNLHLLSDVGLARAVATPDGKARFDARPDRHHHLRCVSCGGILDLFDARLDVEVPEDILAQTGFVVLDHEVQLAGVCPECQRTDGVQGGRGSSLRRRSGPRGHRG